MSDEATSQDLPAGDGPARGWRAVALPPLTAAVVAAALRMWTLAAQCSGNALFRTAILDDADYLQLAGGTAAGEAWFLAPLYPWLLGVVAPSGGATLATAQGLAVVLGALAAALVALAAGALHSRTAAWAAGLLYAGAGTFVFHEVLPGQEPLLSVLHALALWLAVIWCGGGDRSRLRELAVPLLLGAVVGVAMLGRATSVALAIGAVAVAVARLRPRSVATRGAALVVLGLAVALVPAALRNHGATGVFTPFPWSAGSNLYMANGPESRELLTYRASAVGESPAAMRAQTKSVAEDAAGCELGPYEVSSYWRGRTWDERGSAGEIAAHLAKKALLFFSAVEQGSNHYVEQERRHAPWLRFLPVGGWWVLALGVGGWWLVRRRTPEADIVGVGVLLGWAALTLFFPLPRYRLPLLTLLSVTGGAGIAETLRLGTAAPRVRSAAAVTIVCLGLAWIPVVTGMVDERGAAATYRNEAGLLLREGRVAEAEEAVRLGLDVAPDDGPCLVLLGDILTRRGRAEEALARYREAEKDVRTQWIAGGHAVGALAQLGRFDVAERMARLTLEQGALGPAERAVTLANLALVAHGRGDRAGVDALLAEADRLSSGHPHVARIRAAVQSGQ